MADEASGRTGDLPGRLAVLVGPVAEELGLELVDVEVKGQKGRRVVRLVADADGGLDIDQIAALSRGVGDAIDEVVDGAYTLEVTSPGVDRPLRSERDFVRNVGRDVRIQRTSEAAQKASGEVTGRIVEVVDGVIRLNAKGRPTSVALADVDHAKVVLPW